MSLLTRSRHSFTPLLRLATPTRASSHGPSYNQPTGQLFGEPAVKAGERRVKEDWELIYYWGMGGGMALAGVLIYFKPDTTLEGWATKEAKARMEHNGTTPTYTRS